MAAKNILIMGAAGKDFHVFNTIYRDRPEFHVVAITATQIPNIDDRKYPAQLAGKLYPDGIPIKPERSLASLIKKDKVDEVVFAYSDVSYEYIEGKRKLVEEAGAKFSLPDPNATMIRSSKPVVAVCAVRTGAGKSQTSRRVVDILTKKGKKVVVVRHPMPYGDLVRQEVQRFATMADMEKHECTIEEMEEYEPHIQKGVILYAGVDYGKILRQAEKEADVVIWDGGNNDTPFYKPDVHITIADPLRPGHELLYYPGRVNFEMAGCILINKCDSAAAADVAKIVENAGKHNPGATIIKANSPIFVEQPELIKGKRVLAVEDGPTLTHGGMKFGAGVLAAKRFGAKELVDPRPFLTGSLADTFKQYPGIGILLPAMGYGPKQVKDLEETINKVDCDTVIIGTPIDLNRIIKISRPNVRVRYELEEIGRPTLEDILARI
jgi:predicted GTPase